MIKPYRMDMFFLHFSAMFLDVSWTTQEHLHNDTKWFLIFSWKQPRRLQNGFDFQWNFNSVFIQIDITEAKLGLGLQNGFDFFGFMLDWALQNGVEFYLKKWTTIQQLYEILQNGF